MTQSKDYRKGATRRAPSRKGIPSWIWAVVGVGFGLAVAGIYTHYKNRPAREVAAIKPNKHGPISENDLPESEAGPAGPYTYDKQLKDTRVEIPEKSADQLHDARPIPELRPGTYVLQIAAYHTEAEADRQRARLAMIGVESKTQPVTANDQILYRVRVGPFKSLDELNRVRTTLRKAEIDSQQMRLSD